METSDGSSKCSASPMDHGAVLASATWSSRLLGSSAVMNRTNWRSKWTRLSENPPPFISSLLNFSRNRNLPSSLPNNTARPLVRLTAATGAVETLCRLDSTTRASHMEDWENQCDDTPQCYVGVPPRRCVAPVQRFAALLES